MRDVTELQTTTEEGIERPRKEGVRETIRTLWRCQKKENTKGLLRDEYSTLQFGFLFAFLYLIYSSCSTTE